MTPYLEFSTDEFGRKIDQSSGQSKRKDMYSLSLGLLDSKTRTLTSVLGPETDLFKPFIQDYSRQSPHPNRILGTPDEELKIPDKTWGLIPSVFSQFISVVLTSDGVLKKKQDLSPSGMPEIDIFLMKLQRLGEILNGYSQDVYQNDQNAIQIMKNIEQQLQPTLLKYYKKFSTNDDPLKSFISYSIQHSPFNKLATHLSSSMKFYPACGLLILIRHLLSHLEQKFILQNLSPNLIMDISTLPALRAYWMT